MTPAHADVATWAVTIGPPPLGMRFDPDKTAALDAYFKRNLLSASQHVAYVGNRYTALISIDHGYLHVSLSHQKRYPTWNEIKAVREWAFPEDMEVVMVLARAGEYVNLHPNCFHLWQSACGREGR